MDIVSSLLADQHGDGAFVIRSDLAEPWALRIEDRAPLTAVAVVQGDAVLRPDGQSPLPLVRGDVALVRGTVDYTVGDEDGTAPLALIGPGQTCSRPDGSPLSELRMLGARAWTNVAAGADPTTVLLTGTYGEAGQISHRLLRILPDVVLAPADSVPQVQAATALLHAETDGHAPGQDVVTDRIVDVLTVSVLRWWLQRNGGAGADLAPGDAITAAAMRCIQHEPDRPWTVASLAQELAVSRATLSRRFTAAAGVPVIEYLTRWRLDTAADLLTQSDLTLGSIAARVGYSSGFSLSAAFSRRFGLSPRQYRQEASSATDRLASAR